MRILGLLLLLAMGLAACRDKGPKTEVVYATDPNVMKVGSKGPLVGDSALAGKVTMSATNATGERATLTAALKRLVSIEEAHPHEE
jgi:ABC-type Fe3+-hydroxamate transport system substrate-binding protein